MGVGGTGSDTPTIYVGILICMSPPPVRAGTGLTITNSTFIVLLNSVKMFVDVADLPLSKNQHPESSFYIRYKSRITADDAFISVDAAESLA